MTMAIVSPLPSATDPPPPDAGGSVDDDVDDAVDAALEVAFEAAQLRLSAAKKWAEASAALLESARSQVTLSREELRDARNYLRKLKRGRGNGRGGDRPSAAETEDGSASSGSASSGSGTSGDSRSSPPPRDSWAANETEDARVPNVLPNVLPPGASPNGVPDSFLHIWRGRRALSGDDYSAASATSPQGARSLTASLRRAPALLPAIEVTGCGIDQANGRYARFEDSDGVPSYSRIGAHGGVEAIFTVGRHRSNGGDGARRWRVVATVPRAGEAAGPRRVAFYVALAPSFATLPPRRGWMVIEDGDPALPPGYEGGGAYPCPAVEHLPGPDGGGNVLGMSVGSQSSGRRGGLTRQRSRSLSSAK